MCVVSSGSCFLKCREDGTCCWNFQNPTKHIHQGEICTELTHLVISYGIFSLAPPEGPLEILWTGLNENCYVVLMIVVSCMFCEINLIN